MKKLVVAPIRVGLVSRRPYTRKHLESSSWLYQEEYLFKESASRCLFSPDFVNYLSSSVHCFKKIMLIVYLLKTKNNLRHFPSEVDMVSSVQRQHIGLNFLKTMIQTLLKRKSTNIYMAGFDFLDHYSVDFLNFENN